MLHLLIDTSTWLDLAKRRDGQRLIVPIRVLVFQRRLDVLVPQVVIDEFERSRPRVEASMTSEVTQRFKLIRRDLVEYGNHQQSEALEMIDQLAHQVPLIGAMTTRNFEEIREQLTVGRESSRAPRISLGWLNAAWPSTRLSTAPATAWAMHC